MHGFSSGYTFLVNAEVDSMGGVIESGVGIGTKKPSPRRASVEKAQAELRLEYDVREERRRELEFLEKGGNPLDFKFGRAASVSFHSTSHTDHHPDHLLTSEAKGSFALAASPHGDSVESSGRLGATSTCELNSADNFDGENDLLESEKKSVHRGKGSITLSEHSSQLDGNQTVKESEDSPIFHPKKGQAYRRRNRSRPNRDGPRSSSTDMATHGHGLSLSFRQGMLSKHNALGNNCEMEADGTHAPHSLTISRSRVLEGKLDLSTSKDKQVDMESQSVKTEEAPVTTSAAELEMVTEKANIVPEDVKCPPCSDANIIQENATVSQLNESSKMNGDIKCPQTEDPISNAMQTMKNLDSESSCTQTSISIDGVGNIDSELNANLKSRNSNGADKEHELLLGKKSLSKDQKMVNEKHATDVAESGSCIKEGLNSASNLGNGFADKDPEEIDKGRSLGDEEEGPLNGGELDTSNHAQTKSEKQVGQLKDSVPKIESSCPVPQPPAADPSCHELSRTEIVAPLPSSQTQTCGENPMKVVDKDHEDRVLEEAQIIEAKRKRIAQLSVGLLPREYRRKSQWDFVIEEMAWLANDFAQERLWKVSAAAQIGNQVVSASRLRWKEQNECRKQKSVAHTLAKAVMDFWHSAQLLIENVNGSQSEKCNDDARPDVPKVAEYGVGGPDKDNDLEQKLQSYGWKRNLAVHKYAFRFLQFNCSLKLFARTEVSGSTNTGSDIDLPEVLWQEHLTEENLFYVVPLGAMETYRKSIESCLVESERNGKNMQEEVDTSLYDTTVEFGFQENDYEEDEGENVYYLPGAYDASKPSKKKRKNMKSSAPRSYEQGGDFAHGLCMENRNVTLQSILMGKRPSNSLHVGPIPTKRMRTASRQRVVGPFSAGPGGVAPALSRPDVSSGDTNSFQDDQSTFHGGFVVRRGSEVDSAMDFEKQSTFDSTEISAKPKKKKKIKHQGSAYDQRWQLESAMQNEQKDLMKKRLDGYQHDSNGNSGLFGQHAKKPKLMKQSFDASFDNTMPMSASVASPVASQMSNMSSQSKIIKLIGGRDRGRKTKALKVPAGQSGVGSPWSLFEEQALVVLVHDMGPNWELVSDAINSTLQFKCIYRKPQECKERHKILMDRTSSDGADSAEDSGSSQPYPSTLPGIPKGSARQLFQRLQGPMEEDAIKSHFEKIIFIGQQLDYKKKQNDNQDMKQIAPVHGSHVVALSQVIPNYVHGAILTPLDLCEAVSNQEMLGLGGYQAPHAGGLALPNQGAISPAHPPNGLNSSLQGVQGSPNLGISSNLASTSQFNGPRDPRLSVRPGSLPIEEQQRRQYNHMLSGRNMQPSNMPSSGGHSGPDRGIHMLPGGNSVGMVAGMSRSMSMSRPGLPGITSSSSMLNSGSMLPSNLNMHSGAVPGHGNSVFRPRDALQMVKPGQSSEHQRKMMMPEMHMQGTQSNSSGVSSYGGLNSGFSTQATSPPLQTYSGHHQQQHPLTQQQQHPHVHSNPHLHGSNHVEQQAMLRLRERQIQNQRLLQRQQQHQQLPASTALITHPQTPMSSSVQSSSQFQSQATSQPASSPMTHVSSQQQPKHQVPLHGLGRNAQSPPASGAMNQVGKQRQRQLQQQYQQSSRLHPQQRQLSQSQQQAKGLKGVGRSKVLMHQNVPGDTSPLNGISASPGAQAADKGDQPVHVMQGQGLYSGSALNAMPQSKSLASPQASNHSPTQKLYANTIPTTTKQAPSHLDNSNQSQIPAVSSAPGVGTSMEGGISSTATPSHSHQQLQGQLKPPHKVVNQPHPALQRPIQQSRQARSELLTKSQADTTMEQQFANSTSKGNSSAVATVAVDSTNAVLLSSSASTAARKVHESLCDSVPSSSTSSGLIDSPVPPNSSGIEPLPSVSQGIAQRQLSGKVVLHGHSVGSQWQQQQSPLQQSLPLQPVLTQKHSQQPQIEQSHRVPKQQSQPPSQSTQDEMLTRTGDSRLE